MGSAELKENGKRVKHCFPRKEVYHRWIHDDTYVYSNQNYIVSGKYDWLFAFRLNKNADRNTITYSWNSNLRSIEFRQKQTDNHKLLDNWEYVVIIGCHHIWIDDFMSFVKYYNLEDKFGIN